MSLDGDCRVDLVDFIYSGADAYLANGPRPKVQVGFLGQVGLTS